MARMEILDDLSLGKPPVDVRALGNEMGLSLLRCHVSVGNEPAEDHGGTAAAARLAVHVDLVAEGDLLVHELDGRFHVFQAGWYEIDRGDP